ncbi:S8 family peptidase [Ectobacillus ponti]|uniref:S8 family peptidase n=1 Tax=Ectobacillus ponti TaxID=2961894 RepID=A0AA42BT09_9BACI|nr:S8 family peptidase [Ectobacillus ponti]MCP8968998.1 S8 family peptidase [Ectobacillus ponti]
MSKSRGLEHIKIKSPLPREYKDSATPQNKKIPLRDSSQHVQNLKKQLADIKKQGVEILSKRKNTTNDGEVLLTVKGQKNQDLLVKGLESKKNRVKVVKVGINKDNEPYAVVKTSIEGMNFFANKFHEYETNRTGKGRHSHEDVVNSIEAISLALIKELWSGDPEKIPQADSSSYWWEVWIDGGKDDRHLAMTNRESFLKICQSLEIMVDEENFLVFPDRQVMLAYGNSVSLAEAILHTSAIVELCNPTKAIADWYFINKGVDFGGREDGLAILPPEESFSRIAIIDTGISDAHPYLEKATKKGTFSLDPRGDTSDYEGHGTSMAGIALYEDLTSIIMNKKEYKLPAWIESIRINLADNDDSRELWGKTVADAVTVVERDSESGVNRVFCMAIGAESVTLGKPSSWSAAIDQLAFNNGKSPRLFVVSAGNIQDQYINMDSYPYNNLSSQLDDPGQARNAITVGAVTFLDTITEPRPSFDSIAKSGQISPYTKSHIPKSDAIKPDIVCEGGNIAHDGTFSSSGVEGLCLVTTDRNFTNMLFTTFWATSAATAHATRLVAQIWNENPRYKSETVRGLLIHSASWTDQMRAQFKNKRDLFRTCGYGVPNLEFALKSSRSSVTLISETKLRVSYNEMVPGKRKMKKGKMKRDILIYELPWPEDVLLKLGEQKVELRVTLSYFIEPNPKNTLSKYEGAGLKWDLKGTAESDEEFFKRINAAERDEDEKGFRSPDGWEVGIQQRSRGSVQSDRWIGTAASLASRNKVAVFSSYGWWRDNPAKHPNPEVPFSLIVTITALQSDIDLYTEILNNVKIQNMNILTT